MPYINARAVTYVHKINACLAQHLHKVGRVGILRILQKNSIAFYVYVNYKTLLMAPKWTRELAKGAFEGVEEH